MREIRVLRLYHSAVVDEYRNRERLLRSRHGYDVHLICPPGWSEGGSLVIPTADPDVPLHLLGVRGPRHPILFWHTTSALRRVLREVRPHIVDMQEEPYSMVVAVALRAIRAEVPDARICIYSAQNILKRYPPPFRQLERQALATAAAAYPCSTEAGRVLRAKGFAGALHALPLGVSMPPPRSSRTDDGELRVGFLGRLEPYKGGEIAVRAFAKAARDLDASLELVGSGTQQVELEACVNQLGLDGRVVFTGAVPQEEALRRIGSYDVVVAPSLTTPRWKEQFGRVVAQALAAETPVVASDSGSLPEILGGCGELVREGDVDDLADKLGRLLRDPGRRADLAAKGRQRACEHLTWEQVANGCDRMYRHMLELPTGAAASSLQPS
jgi:glycosyltransferase involved in cell wall biosynthesis